jgi:two-component system OmpR family sensor kinase
MLTRLSLRARLLLAVIALAAVGLVVADVVTYSSLRSFLVDRADRSLDDNAHSLREPDFRRGRPAPPGVAVEIRSLSGTTVLATLPSAPVPGRGAPSPRFPATIDPPSDAAGRDRARYFTVPGEEGGERYRVRASIEPGATAMLVVAASLRDADSTLDRLLLIELIVTALVLAGIVALGLWTVRLGLRPLDAIGETAAAIGAGDLSRRVERADERTEVGRLGLALNAMLAQIESAFGAREESERKLRRFVADASHELRTPLAAVRAYAELFTRGASERPDDLARSMAGISRESERMSLLVDDLLLLARLDEGRPLELRPVELDDLVSEAVETAQAVEPERPIELEVDPAVVLGDRDRLRQIVDNLLANVRSHTPPGTPARVTVRRENGTAEIAVADSGPGLDAEQVAHLFERFYRADASRARASGGVGLGLAIVLAVAEAHGGSVAARSEPGHGATFEIVLPLAELYEGPQPEHRRLTGDELTLSASPPSGDPPSRTREGDDVDEGASQPE